MLSTFPQSNFPSITSVHPWPLLANPIPSGQLFDIFSLYHYILLWPLPEGEARWIKNFPFSAQPWKSSWILFFRGEGFIPFDLPEALPESFQNPLVLLDQTSKSREAQINVPLPSSFLIQRKKKKLISLPPVWDMSPLIIRVVPGELGTGVYYGPWQRYYLVAASQARDDLESLSFFWGGLLTRPTWWLFAVFTHRKQKKNSEGKKSKCFGMLSQRDKCSPNCSWGEREEKTLQDKRYSSSRNL